MSCSANDVEVDITVSYYNEICCAFKESPILSRNELYDYLRNQKPILKNSSLGWLLYNLCKKNIIERVSHNAYSLYNKEKRLVKYEVDLSDEAVSVLESMQNHFPLVSFIVWETRAYNEFSNHQLARNMIFIEVEKPYTEFIFNALHEQDRFRVLFKPSEKEIAMYTVSTTVIVLPLTSEAPIHGKNARLEKLLVDLFANTLLDKIISKGEYTGIYEEAFSKYDINYSVMLRYAKRRGKDNELKDFIESRTTIFVTGEISK